MQSVYVEVGDDGVTVPVEIDNPLPPEDNEPDLVILKHEKNPDNTDGTNVAGVKFNLYDEHHTKIAEGRTEYGKDNKEGRLVFEDLQPGTYIVEEDINNYGDTYLTDPQHAEQVTGYNIQSKQVTLTEDDKQKTVEIINYRYYRTTVNLTKTEANADGTSGAEVKDIWFKLYR